MEEPKNTQPFLLAPFSKRLLNWFVDFVLIIFILTLVMDAGDWAAKTYGYDFLSVGSISPDVPNPRLGLFYGLVSIMYYGLFESFLQRTPGKFITGTRVIRFDGTLPTEWNILLRSLLRFIPFEALSFLGPVPFGLHDSLSKTFVVRTGKMPARFNGDSNAKQ
jgi:uncharacterized RDD family membrane protein YckC